MRNWCYIFNWHNMQSSCIKCSYCSVSTRTRTFNKYINSLQSKIISFFGSNFGCNLCGKRSIFSWSFKSIFTGRWPRNCISVYICNCYNNIVKRCFNMRYTNRINMNFFLWFPCNFNKVLKSLKINYLFKSRFFLASNCTLFTFSGSCVCFCSLTSNW